MCARWFAHVTNNDGNQPVCLGQPHTVRNFRKVCITVQFFFLSNPYLNVFQFFLSSPLHILLFLCTISNLFEFFVFSDSLVQLHDCKRSSKIASMSSRYMCSKWYAHQTPCFFFEWFAFVATHVYGKQRFSWNSYSFACYVEAINPGLIKTRYILPSLLRYLDLFPFQLRLVFFLFMVLLWKCIGGCSIPLVARIIECLVKGFCLLYLLPCGVEQGSIASAWFRTTTIVH
jgi:hypothetical protein